MSETVDKFDAWALVEVMGHQRYAGRVTEQAIGGCNFVRVDIPDVPPVNGRGARQGFTKLLGQSSIFAITPVTEETARQMASQYDSAPFVVFDGRPPQTEFWTWAYPHVFGGIKDALRKRDDVPRLIRSAERRRKTYVQEFAARFGRDPTCEETMFALRWSRQQWAASFPSGTESIETVVAMGDYDRIQTLRDLLRSCEEAPESALDADAFWEDLTCAFSMRERIIFCLRYQFEASMKSIGACLGLSESRISQMMTSLDQRAVERLAKERAA